MEEIEHGHVWSLDRTGAIDLFAFEEGYHNGPHCMACGEYFCEHCEPNIFIRACPARAKQPELQGLSYEEFGR